MRDLVLHSQKPSLIAPVNFQFVQFLIIPNLYALKYLHEGCFFWEFSKKFGMIIFLNISGQLPLLQGDKFHTKWRLISFMTEVSII